MCPSATMTTKSSISMSPSTAMDIDEEVRLKYGIYLRALKRVKLTDSMWIVDTGAGHALTPDKGWFSSLRRSTSHTFVYGNGSTSSSQMIESILLNVFNPAGHFRTVKLSDVAYDSKCGSNLLSAYYLAKQGCQFTQSKSGDFLYFLGEGRRLLFVAVAIGEVYYLPTQKVERKRIINALQRYTPFRRKYS